MVVKVYGPVTAACPQRVLTCLVEMDIQFEVIPIDLESGQQKSPDFLTLQPFGQVPVIQDGDFRLFESRAISRYYAAKYADKGSNLLGKTLEEQALVQQWMEVEAHHLNEAVFGMVLQLLILPRMGKSSDTKVVEECEQRLEKVLDVYEKQLSKSTYLAGNDFTLADLSNLPPVGYVMKIGKAQFVRDRKCVSAWWDTISSRPSWKKIMSLANN